VGLGGGRDFLDAEPLLTIPGLLCGTVFCSRLPFGLEFCSS